MVIIPGNIPGLPSKERFGSKIEREHLNGEKSGRQVQRSSNQRA